MQDPFMSRERTAAQRLNALAPVLDVERLSMNTYLPTSSGK